ncbi:hypothetical protein ACFQZC_34845 [Streptacidiphilus monticola]
MDRDLYPRPLNLREQEPLMAARLKTLTAMAWSHDETEARRSSPLVLLLSQDLRAEVSHGLRSWLLSFLRERSGLPQLAADIGEVDLRDQPSALRALRDDLLPHAAAALDALPPASSRWSRSDLRTLSSSRPPPSAPDPPRAGGTTPGRGARPGAVPLRAADLLAAGPCRHARLRRPGLIPRRLCAALSEGRRTLRRRGASDPGARR